MPQRNAVSSRRPRRRVVIALAATLALLVGACSSSDGDDATPPTGASDTSADAVDPSAPCPTEVDEEDFASAEELRDLLAEFNDFGLRSPGSDAHEASLDWLADELGAVPGMEVEWDEYEIDRWQPTTEADGRHPRTGPRRGRRSHHRRWTGRRSRSR